MAVAVGLTSSGLTDLLTSCANCKIFVRVGKLPVDVDARIEAIRAGVLDLKSGRAVNL